MKKVDKYWLFIFGFLIVGLIMVVIVQYQDLGRINSRIDTVNTSFKKLDFKGVNVDSNVKLQQFKEDSYIKQLDRDTNLILWFVAIVFGLFGLLSFASFNRRVVKLEEDLNAKMKGHTDSFIVLKEEIQDLEASLNEESAKINDQLAMKFYKDKNYSYFITYELISVLKSSKTFLYEKESNKGNALLSLDVIRTSLEDLNSKLIGLSEKPELDQEHYFKFIRSIEKVEDNKVSIELTKLTTLIELTEKDE